MTEYESAERNLAFRVKVYLNGVLMSLVVGFDTEEGFVQVVGALPGQVNTHYGKVRALVERV